MRMLKKDNELLVSLRKALGSEEDVTKLVRSMLCACCFSSAVEAHHRKTRGAGGDDSFGNLMPLCSKHHREWHSSGEAKMRKKYYSLDCYLHFIESDQSHPLPSNQLDSEAKNGF